MTETSLQEVRNAKAQLRLVIRLTRRTKAIAFLLLILNALGWTALIVLRDHKAFLF